MSTNINTQSLKKFIMQTLNVGQKLDFMEAKNLGVTDEYNKVDKDEAYIYVADALNNEDLYTKFATMYIEYTKAENNEVDEEKAKEEQNRVNEKNEPKA